MRQRNRRLKDELERADIDIIHAVAWDKAEEIVEAQKRKHQLMREALKIRDEDEFLLVTGMTKETAKRCYGEA